jgi:subtilisin-like proprotein convertase family protein
MIMKINLTTIFNFGNATRRREAGSIQPLRINTQNIKPMNRLKALIIIGLIGAAAPPLLWAQSTETYTFTTNRVIPDGNAAGLQDVRSVSSSIGTISSVKVRLKIDGEFNGDLYGYLRHVQNGVTNFSVLLNRSGRTSINSAGYSDSGFNVTFDTAAVNGDIHVYRNVTTPTAGSPLTGIWQPDGRTTDPANVLNTSPRTSSLTSFNGANAAGEWTLFLADVESGGTNMLREWGLDITGGAYPVIAWSNPADITYGTALGAAQLNAVATYNSTNVNGTFTYTPTAGTILNYGAGRPLSVTFTPTDATGLLAVSTNVTINVLQAPLSITANSSSKTYGSVVTFTGTEFTTSGLVNGNTVTSVSLASAGAAATASVSGSPYNIVPSAAVGTGLTNYNIGYVNGSLTVNTKPLTITANNRNKPYGSTATFLGTEFSTSGLVNGDTVTSVTLNSAGAISTATVSGSPYSIVPSAALGTGLGNYAIGYVNGALTITPVEITVTADNKTKAYGQALPVLTASYSGFVLSQDTNVLTALATVGTAATATSDVGNYPITVSGAASPNYTFNYVAGTLTITQSVTIGTITSSANPAVPGASVTFTMTSSAVAPGAGTPSGTVNFRIDGIVAGFGTLSGGSATFATSALTVGSHTVVAEYAGTVNFIGSTNTLTPTQVINTPPIAGNDIIERYPTQGVKVRLTTLTANDNDADGDTLTPTVSSTSTNGGSIVVSGDGWVTYTPVPGFTNVDAFTYLISDGRGGSATNVVTIAIKVDNSVGQSLTITDIGGGSFRLNGSGIPGRTYRLQSTDSLSPVNWQNLLGGSVTADTNGAFIYIDSSGSSTRYYRSVYP